MEYVAPEQKSENDQMENEEALTMSSEDILVTDNSQACASAATPSSEDVQLLNQRSQACDVSVTTSYKDVTLCSGYIKREKMQFQTFPAQKTSHEGYVKGERMPYQASETSNLQSTHRGSSINESVRGPRQTGKYNSHKQMNYPNEQLDIMRMKLLKKNLFLTEEKERRIAAEEDCKWHWKKLTEVELTLEDGRQFTLTLQKELDQCKGIITNLHQSSKALEAERKSRYEQAQKMTLTELEN